MMVRVVVFVSGHGVVGVEGVGEGVAGGCG